MNDKIFTLKVALLTAIAEANKHKNDDDGGTSNWDMPLLFLPLWERADIEEAFKIPGLRIHFEGNAIYILGVCDGQGYRRTAMAEAFRDSLKNQGYKAHVDYRMD